MAHKGSSVLLSADPQFGPAEILQKHVATVHCSAPFTLKERHCANVLLFNAMSDGIKSLKIERQHSIYLPDLCELVFGDRDNRERINRTLNGLLRKRVYWAFTDEKARSRWGASTWLAGYNVKDRVLYYSYSAEIVDEILEPKIFARLNFSIQHRIARSHTQTLYENCARYRDWGSTKFWDLDTFRGLMGIEDRKSYREFKCLNRAVIKPAVAEINQKTEIHVEPVFHKRGHEVYGVRFEVSENTDYAGPYMPVISPLSQKFDSGMLEARIETYDRLLIFGVDHSRAIDVLEQYDDDYIMDNLQIVAERIRTGGNRIKNIPGYAINALKQDFRTDDTNVQQIMNLETVEERDERIAKEKEAAASAKLARFETEDLPQWRVNRWEQSLNSLEYEQAHQQFKDDAIAENTFLRRMFKDNPEGAWLGALWRKWVREKKLPPVTDEVRLECAREIDFDLNGALIEAGEEPVREIA